MLLNWDVREDSWISWTARRTNQPILKEISSEYPFGRADAETEAPILWPPDVKNWLIGKCPDAGKDWRQKKKGMTEDEVVGLHHWLDGHRFEQTRGFSDGQGIQACCSPGGHRVGNDSATKLNWIKEYTYTKKQCQEKI